MNTNERIGRVLRFAAEATARRTTGPADVGQSEEQPRGKAKPWSEVIAEIEGTKPAARTNRVTGVLPWRTVMGAIAAGKGL